MVFPLVEIKHQVTQKSKSPKHLCLSDRADRLLEPAIAGKVLHFGDIDEVNFVLSRLSAANIPAVTVLDDPSIDEQF